MFIMVRYQRYAIQTINKCNSNLLQSKAEIVCVEQGGFDLDLIAWYMKRRMALLSSLYFDIFCKDIDICTISNHLLHN